MGIYQSDDNSSSRLGLDQGGVEVGQAVLANGAAGDASGRSTPPPRPFVNANGWLPPLGNTGGNSPNPTGGDKEFNGLRHGQPAAVGLGWLKMRLPKLAFETLESVFVRVGLTGPCKPISGGQQHRRFGFQWWWGGKVYYGRILKDEGEGVVGRDDVEFMPTLTPGERSQVRATGLRVGEVGEEDPILDLGATA